MFVPSGATLRDTLCPCIPAATAPLPMQKDFPHPSPPEKGPNPVRAAALKTHDLPTQLCSVHSTSTLACPMQCSLLGLQQDPLLPGFPVKNR